MSVTRGGTLTRERALQLYIVLVGCVTVAVVGGAVAALARMQPQDVLTLAPGILLLTGLGWFSSQRRVLINASSTWVVGTTTQTVTILLLPFPAAILTVALAKILAESWMIVKKGSGTWVRSVVNVGATVLANAAGAAAFHALPISHYLWQGDWQAFRAVPALMALAGLYYLTDVLVILVAITLSSRETPWTVFGHITRGALLPEFSLILMGIVVAALWHFSPVLTLFLIVPVLMSIRAFEAVGRLRKETVEAVLKMAESIDYRDTGTYEHSKRLVELTRRLAVAVGLTREHIDDVILAAQVHDLGKIGISNAILLKPGKLTAEERQIMQEHPAIGADILASYSAFTGSVDIVRHHHERWDGSGYPDGLKGEAIPVGARIIAVVDAFDAMTADRPYRKGMSVDCAVEELKAGIGAQFDPKVCASFIQMLIEDGEYAPSGSPPVLHVVSEAS